MAHFQETFVSLERGGDRSEGGFPLDLHPSLKETLEQLLTMHRALGFSQDPVGRLWNAHANVLAASEEDLSRLVGDVHDLNKSGPLLVSDDLAGKAGEFRFVGFNAVKSFDKL